MASLPPFRRGYPTIQATQEKPVVSGPALTPKTFLKQSATSFPMNPASKCRTQADHCSNPACKNASVALDDKAPPPERLGYAVLTASTPYEAIDLAHEHTDPIHLVITDVVMPEMNGKEMARSLLSLYPNLKCLFMSGYPADVIAPSITEEEGVHFIQKPFTKQDLATKIRKVL